MLVSKNPQITTAELAENIGISQKGIDWQINRLKKEGVLERIGPAKGGQWKVISSGFVSKLESVQSPAP